MASARSSSSETRDRILRIAERLLVESPDHDVSTRAVCEAAGVAPPILYRIFGDKNGLLTALVDDGFERYIARKVSLEATADPLADLRAGWVDHMAFAEENPQLYRLMFSPSLRAVPATMGRVFELLKHTLERCAAIGAMRVTPDAAAQLILSVNVGVALNRISQPDRYSDPDLSLRARESVFATCLVEPGRAPRREQEGLVAAALHLRAQLSAFDAPGLTSEEGALLASWLDRIGSASLQVGPEPSIR